MSTRRFFASLDGIRGIAAALIVLRHAEDFFRPIAFQESYLAVDLFFILSGFVLANAYDERLRTNLSGTKFLLLRIVRLYPLYLIGTLVAILNEVASIHWGFSSTSGSDLLKESLPALWMLPNLKGGNLYPLNTPSWSLFFELVASCLYGYFATRLTHKKLIALMSFSAAALIGSGVVGYFHHRQSTLDVGFFFAGIHYGLFRVLYSFSAGLFIYRSYKTQPLKSSSRWPDFTKYLAIAFIVLLLAAHPTGWHQVIFDRIVVLLAFPLLIYFIVATEKPGDKNPAFAFLGAASYALYVLHKPLARLIEVTLQAKANIDVRATAPWSGLLLLAFLLVLCWYLEKFIDLPIRRYLGKRIQSS